MAKDTSAVPLDEAVRAVRVSSRRRQVLDAAVTVMQRTGFHQMSMQALADEAQVSVGLIYKYFGGKEDILLARSSTSSTPSAISSSPRWTQREPTPSSGWWPGSGAMSRSSRESGCRRADVSGKSDARPGRA